MDRAYEKALGTALTAVGVALLLFGFYQAYTDIHDLSSNQAPLAKFQWTVTGLDASFHDNSTAGSSSISSVYWTFGDGDSSSSPDPTHTYAVAGSYNVTLSVQDSNGNAEESTAQIMVGPSASGSGGSSPSSPYTGNGNSSSLGSALGPLFGSVSGVLKTVETFVLLGIEYLVGASILKAGWNLITPKAETISVRVKPKDLQVEPAGYSAAPPTTGGSTSPPSSAGTGESPPSS